MRGWLLVGQKCTSAIPSPSRLYTVTISSMPEGDSVSITAVFATMDLKLVFTGWCLSSVPSHSPASACSFLKAAVAWNAAKTLLAAARARMAKIDTRFFMRHLEAWALNQPHLCLWPEDFPEGKPAIP